jgi:hypothetical protein
MHLSFPAIFLVDTKQNFHSVNIDITQALNLLYEKQSFVQIEGAIGAKNTESVRN